MSHGPSNEDRERDEAPAWRDERNEEGDCRVMSAVSRLNWGSSVEIFLLYVNVQHSATSLFWVHVSSNAVRLHVVLTRYDAHSIIPVTVLVGRDTPACDGHNDRPFIRIEQGVVYFYDYPNGNMR